MIVKLYLIAVIMLLASSCAYYPHLTDIPLIREKGDTRVKAGFAVLPWAFNASVSHGITDNIAIQAVGIKSFTDGIENYYVHGAAGFFKNIGERGVMELYGGFGYGYDDFSGQGIGNLYGNYQTYFTQFNLGKINGKTANSEFGFGVKTGYMHSKMTDRNYYSFGGNGAYDYENEQYPVLNMDNIVVEPVLFLRLDLPKIPIMLFEDANIKMKFQMELGTCALIQLNRTDKQYPYFPLNFGLGLNCSF